MFRSHLFCNVVAVLILLGYFRLTNASNLRHNFENLGDKSYGQLLRRIKRTCAPLWYNQCFDHAECCSLYCSREPSWRYGVCKPNPAGNSNVESSESSGVVACKPLWFNQCVSNFDCCSKNCERQFADWKYGVCGPSEEMLGRRGECKPKGFQFCKVNSDCCSTNCNRKPDHAYGTCEGTAYDESEIAPTEKPTPKPTQRPLTKATSRPTRTTTTTTTATVEEPSASFECGISEVPSFDLRIIGGRNASRDEFPWQASIRTEDSERDDSHVCGGAIISKDYVLSAAHCVSEYKPEDIVVVVGSYYLQQKVKGETHHDVEKLFVHENYKRKTYDNDIALIKLSNEVEFDRHKKPICLPTSDEKMPRLLTVSGWGTTEERGHQSNILQTVNVRTIEMKKCRQLLKEAKLTANMICAGEEGKDSCQGDSGGPLFSKGEGPAKLFGVVSFGIGCGRKDRTGVYTKITNYIDWINSHMN